MTGTLVLLSGGLDSTVLLAHTMLAASTNDDPVRCLSVDYGQRHAREIHSARAVADHYGVPWQVADLSGLSLLLSSALTGHGSVPDGHYAEKSMAATVVPNRNAIMLMVAAGVAQSHGLDSVQTAVHAGDHPIYADCRPQFIEAINAASVFGTDSGVQIIAPFVWQSKADIVQRGAALNAPMHWSWSCYQGGTMHCGRCGTCVERAEAFYLAGVTDPTPYADPTYWRTVTTTV